jgi:hypothetical protein
MFSVANNHDLTKVRTHERPMYVRHKHLHESLLNIERLDQAGEARRENVLKLVLIKQAN